jgi:glycosyltransferase involved in cell wall biosynthesis
MISVITPVYNGKHFIEGCIQNVIEQANHDVEHVIVDGGSTDGTSEIIAQYASMYTHIRWISEKDQGQSDAMNKGINLAKGKIVNFLNVDDFYEPNTLNRITSLSENLSKPTLLVGNCRILGEEDKLIDINCPRKLDVSSLLRLKSPFPLNPSAYFYHKSLHETIGLFPVDEHYLMDLDFILKAIPNSEAIYYDEIWGNHRQIQGTKTIGLIQSGDHLNAVKKLILSHSKRLLPVHLRVLVLIELEILYRLRYFLSNPKELLLIVKRKFRRVASI